MSCGHEKGEGVIGCMRCLSEAWRKQIIQRQSEMAEDRILITKRHVPNLLKDMEQRVAEQWCQKVCEQIYGSLPFAVRWDGPEVGRIQRWCWRAREWVGNVWHAIKGGTIADD